MKAVIYIGVLVFSTLLVVNDAQLCSNTNLDGLLTEDFATTAQDDVYFFNLTDYFSGIEYGPGNLTLLNTAEQKIFVYLGLSSQFSSDWGLGPNGQALVPVLGENAAAQDDPSSVTIVFSPPVTDLIMKTNYNPAYESIFFNPPLFTTYDENGVELDCYLIHQLANISTPQATNGFGLRGVSNANGIASIAMSGAQIIVWDIKAARIAPPPVATPIDTQIEGPIAAPRSSPQSAPSTKTSNAVAQNLFAVGSIAGLVFLL